MTKPRIAGNSILWKIIAIMAGTMLIQAALLFGTVFYGGTIDELQNNAFDILGEKVSGRKSDIEDNMVQRWSNLTEPVEMINSGFSRKTERPTGTWKTIRSWPPRPSPQ